MLAYSFGAVYYSQIDWKLSRTAINGWQVFNRRNLTHTISVRFSFQAEHLRFKILASIGWLVIPVSVGAVQLWLYLLKKDAVKASLWLFLCLSLV